MLTRQKLPAGEHAAINQSQNTTKNIMIPMDCQAASPFDQPVCLSNESLFTGQL